MTLRARLAGTLVTALAVTLTGCMNDGSPTGRGVSPASPGTGGPLPLAPLPLATAPTGSWSGASSSGSGASSGSGSTGGASSSSSFTLPAGAHVVNLTVNGDPGRVVYPTTTLTPGQLYPVLVFFHGYTKDNTQLTDRTDLAVRAAQQGWLSASADLTGPGHWANDAAQAQSNAFVAALVAQHQADPNRIYYVGFSMGGGTALLLAEHRATATYKPAAVADTQGFTDLTAMTTSAASNGDYASSIFQAYGGMLTPDVAAAHSPIDGAASLQGLPLYLEHGEADQNVPDTHTINLAAKLQSLNIPFEEHLYPGESHNETTINGAAIISFLSGKHL